MLAIQDGDSRNQEDVFRTIREYKRTGVYIYIYVYIYTHFYFFRDNYMVYIYIHYLQGALSFYLPITKVTKEPNFRGSSSALIAVRCCPTSTKFSLNRCGTGIELEGFNE